MHKIESFFYILKLDTAIDLFLENRKKTNT